MARVDRVVADTVSLSSGALHSVQAIQPLESSQRGSSGSNTLQNNSSQSWQPRSQQAGSGPLEISEAEPLLENTRAAQAQQQQQIESQQSGNLDQALTAGLDGLMGDVGRLFRAFGVSGEVATAVEQKFAGKISEKLGEPPHASLGMRVGVAHWRENLQLGVSNIDVSVDNTRRAVSVDFQNAVVGTRQDVIENNYPPPDDHFAFPAEEPKVVDTRGQPVDLAMADRGLYVDLRGQSTTEFLNFLSGRGNTAVESPPPETPPDAVRPPEQQPGPFAATLASGSSTDSTGSGHARRVNTAARSVAAANADAQSGSSRVGEAAASAAPDTTAASRGVDPVSGGNLDHNNFRSLLIMRSGSGVAPLAEGGVTRVKFDAIVNLNVQAQDVAPSFQQQLQQDGPVSRAAEVNLDVNV